MFAILGEGMEDDYNVGFELSPEEIKSLSPDDEVQTVKISAITRRQTEDYEQRLLERAELEKEIDTWLHKRAAAEKQHNELLTTLFQLRADETKKVAREAAERELRKIAEDDIMQQKKKRRQAAEERDRAASWAKTLEPAYNLRTQPRKSAKSVEQDKPAPRNAKAHTTAKPVKQPEPSDNPETLGQHTVEQINTAARKAGIHSNDTQEHLQHNPAVKQLLQDDEYIETLHQEIQNMTKILNDKANTLSEKDILPGPDEPAQPLDNRPIAQPPGNRPTKERRYKKLKTLAKKQHIPAIVNQKRAAAELERDRLGELTRGEQERYAHLVQMFYLNEDNELFEVINTFYRKGTHYATSRRVTENEPVTEQSILAEERFVGLIDGEDGIQAKVTKYIANYVITNWPKTSKEWLNAQLADPFWSIVLARLTDPHMCIPINKPKADEGEEDQSPDVAEPDNMARTRDQPTKHFDYIFRSTNEDGTLGPLKRRTRRKVNLKHGQLDMTVYETREQTIVPAAFIQTCLDIHHEKSGHPGKHKTLENIKQEYYWRSMRMDSAQHCMNCHVCLRRKSNKEHLAVPTAEPDGALWPWWRLHIDLCVELPITAQGHTGILVAKDALSKWVELVPLKDKTQETVAQALASIFYRLGAPAHLVSDRGREFANQLLQKMVHLFGGKHIRTTPINPQSNGTAESFMLVLKDMLSSFVEANQRDWSNYLGLVQMFYNSTVHSATGFTPHLLMTGREMQTPTFDQVQAWRKETPNIADFVDRMVDCTHHLWEAVSNNLKGNSEHFSKALSQEVKHRLNTAVTKQETMFTYA